MTSPQEQPERRPESAEPRRRNGLKAASDAVVDPALAVSNPFAAAALAVGVIAVLFPSLGVLPVIGLVVSVLGLVRSGRMAREGEAKTGRGRCIAGLVLSLVGLLRLLPALAGLPFGG